MIGVDTRWMGNHGIGRYATEVISLLTVAWEPLSATGRPASPFGPLRRPRTASGAPPDLLYSPGFNGFGGNVRQIITVHDLIHRQVSWPARGRYLAYYDGFLRPLIRRNGVVLTVSEASRCAIAEWLRTPDVIVLNTGVGCSPAFTPDGPRATLDRPYLLYVGNLKAHKNVGTILDALRLVDDLDLVLVCGDERRGRSLAAAHHVADRVRPLANLDDLVLARLYRGARATVVPSVREGFGLPALESLCCGTTVIHWSGCASVASTCGRQGMAVSDPYDAHEWAEAMSTESCAPTMPIDHSEHSWSRVADRVNTVLQERVLEDSLR